MSHRTLLKRRDPRRRFSKRQRAILFNRVGGRCQDCSDLLRPGWQADHVIPWAHGGRTEVKNGRALCPYCNLARSDQGERQAPIVGEIHPRGWQADMLNTWRASATPVFAISVAPGAGKTLASGFVAKEAGQLVVVVVPSRAIRAGFIDEYAKLGLQLEPFRGTGVRHGFHGVVVTYQALGDPDTTAALIETVTGRGSFFLVADEIHHAGDATIWGTALDEVLNAASGALLMSGTPYREDKRTIVGVEYDSDNRGSFDFVHSYEDALADGHVIPVRFPLQGGSVAYEIDGVEQIVSTVGWGELKTGQRRRLLTRLFSPKSRYLSSVISSANAELDAIRATRMPHAAGILFTYEQQDARATATLIESLTGHKAEIVVSDDDTSHERLEEFKAGGSGAARWLVTCKMVSEGVDVRRLRVAVWATLIRKSRLFFTQLVGRVQRAVKGVHDDYATVYLPDIGELSTFALSMRAEQAAIGFDIADDRVRVVGGSDGSTETVNVTPIYLYDETWTQGEIAGGDRFTAEESEALAEATKSSPAVQSLYDRLEALRSLKNVVGANTYSQVEHYAGAHRLGEDERIELMRRILAEQAGALGRDHNHINPSVDVGKERVTKRQS